MMLRDDFIMGEKQDKILTAVKDYVEIIESERYNSGDPFITIEKEDTQDDVIVKILTSERTGAPVKFEGELMNTAENTARRNFSNGIRTLNSWQFRSSDDYFREAANLARDLKMQQRINLFKQLSNLLYSVIHTNPERVIKSKGNYFDEVVSLLPKYDLLDREEQNHYRKKINSLYGFACELEKAEEKSLTQQLFARCSISLYHKEYLAAYIWLFKIYLINKGAFDEIANTDEVMQKALSTLTLYIEVETGLKETLEDLPTMASAYDLQSIFADHLTNIFDVEFEKETKMRLSFTEFRD